MSQNLGMAARVGWTEVRGENPVGKQAWAHSIVNRLKSKRWGDTLMAVTLWHDQYSAVGPVVPSNKSMVQDFLAACALPDDDVDLLELSLLIQKALAGEPDPTGGATHYYNPAVVAKPTWAEPPAILCGKFGNQLFYKNVP